MITRNQSLVTPVCRVLYALVSDVESVIQGTDRFHRLVALIEGKEWVEIYLSPGTAEFLEKPKDSEAGDLFEQSLRFTFPGDDESSASALQSFLGIPALVKMVLADGSSKLIGDPGNPAKAIQTVQLNSKVTGSAIEFTCQATERCWWITS